MKYLFFDIECANPRYNSICTFGYFLTDEAFVELAHEDILMNPETSYDKYVIKNILHYTPEELEAHMPFPCFYDKLKELMCGSDTTVLGFSISNDIRFLNETCIRYHLPCLNYHFYDVQKIFGEHIQIKEQTSIEKAGEQLHLEKPMFVHRSDEDARITMEILRAICQDRGMLLPEVLCACPSAEGENKNFIERWTVSGGKDPINHKKNHYKKLSERLAKQMKKKKETNQAFAVVQKAASDPE